MTARDALHSQRAGEGLRDTATLTADLDEVLGQDRQQRQGREKPSLLVAGRHAVRIAIGRESCRGPLLANLMKQRSQVSGHGLGTGASEKRVRLRAQWNHLDGRAGEQLLQEISAHAVHGVMHQFHAGAANLLVHHPVFEGLQVGGEKRRVGRQILLFGGAWIRGRDEMSNALGLLRIQGASIGALEFHSAVLRRIVAGGDHDAQRCSGGDGPPGECRRGNGSGA